MDDPEYADDPSAGPMAAMQLAMYAQELGERRRTDPRDDIVSELLRAEATASGSATRGSTPS